MDGVTRCGPLGGVTTPSLARSRPLVTACGGGGGEGVRDDGVRSGSDGWQWQIHVVKFTTNQNA